MHEVDEKVSYIKNDVDFLIVIVECLNFSTWGLVRDTLDWSSIPAEVTFKMIDFLCNDAAEINLSDM